MSFNLAAAAKTSVVILAIWGCMAFSDLSQVSKAQGTAPAEVVAHAVRSVLGLNGPAASPKLALADKEASSHSAKASAKPMQKGKTAVTAPAATAIGLEVADAIGMYPEGVRAPRTANPAPGGLAAKAGIKGLEWIVAINGQSISTAAEYRQLTKGTGPLTLTVLNTEKDQRNQREVKIR